MFIPPIVTSLDTVFLLEMILRTAICMHNHTICRILAIQVNKINSLCRYNVSKITSYDTDLDCCNGTDRICSPGLSTKTIHLHTEEVYIPILIFFVGDYVVFHLDTYLTVSVLQGTQLSTVLGDVKIELLPIIKVGQNTLAKEMKKY